MANKEFQVRHGLVVNNSVLVANTVTGNVGIGTSNPAYTLDVFGTINAANVLMNGGAIAANLAPVFTVANAAFGVANGAFAQSNNEYSRLSVAFGVANAAYDSANNVAPQVSPAFNTANAAFTVANASFGKANTALQNASGTLSGSLFVTGTLTSMGRFGVGVENTSVDGVVAAGNFWASQGQDRYLHLGSSSNYYWRIKAQYDDLLIHDASNTATVMVKYNTGNLGIGTQAPQSKLSVVTNTSSSYVTTDNTYYAAPYPHELTIQNNQQNTTNTFCGIFFQAGQTSWQSGINAGRLSFVRDSNNSYGGNFTFSNRATSDAVMREVMRVDQGGRITKPYQPSCYVGRSSGAWTGTCIFNVQSGYGFHNTGNHYNGSNGRFTAPISGRYLVTVDSMCNNNNSANHLYYGLHINGSISAYSYGWSISSVHTRYTLSRILNLNATDYIEIIAGVGEFYGNDSRYTTLSVYLLG